MTSLRSDLFRSNRIVIYIALLSIAVFICCALVIGFRYEKKKFKALLTTLVIALIYQIFFADVIIMFLKATYNALLHRHPWSKDVNPIFVGGPGRKEYLKRRIIALKKQLELGPIFYKRNEAMTLRYREVLDDLVIFGGYLLILIVLIIETRDSLLYYNTRTIKRMLQNPIDKIVTSDDLYNFINKTIIEGLNNGTSYNGQPFTDGGWMKWQVAKVLGVVRLRQVRLKSTQERGVFDAGVYGPRWSNDLDSFPIKGKFWRIFHPWEYRNIEKTEDVSRVGKIYYQPGGGYLALLGRNMGNSHRVLNFLHDNDWIDSYTAVIIMEFTLYNVDADIFILVKISFEQTTFDSFVTSVKVSAFKLLFNIDNLPWYSVLGFLLYFLVFMRIVAYVVLKMWFSPSLNLYLSDFWNYVDITIVTLNLCILVGLWTRESFVKMLLLRVESSRKNEYIPFTQAAFIDEVCTVMIAFLIAITTIRLWKILQFAKVFRILTRTLYEAKSSLSSTTFFIFVFIIGIGLTSFIINGSNSPKFMDLLICISSLMSLSFGFTSNVSPTDLNHGGSTLGFIIYAVVVIGVSIFLINMFIIVLCLHFTIQKEEASKTANQEDYYTFWHFLGQELSESIQRGWLGGKGKRSPSRKSKDHAGILRLRGGGCRFGKPKENSANVNLSVEHMRRLQLIAEILDTQLELLTEAVDDNQESQLSGVTVTSVQEQERVEQPATSKNSQRLHRKIKRNFSNEQLKTRSTTIRSP